MIKSEIINQIREQSDIVQLISEYLPLKKAGKYYKTLCPFHNEKSPSFYVNPEKQIYHCFGCGAGGSVFTFLMQYEKLSYPEAIRKLASKIGIILEEDKTVYKYQSLYDACEYAANFYAESLRNSKLAMEYLKYRDISEDTIKRFLIGYAPSGDILFNTARKRGITTEILIKAGLIVKKDDSYHDWFYNRIIFPVFSLSGKIVGFGARRIGSKSEPKYLNSPETPIFKKGQNLYGLFQNKNQLYQNIPILVEGNFDLLSLVDKGITNVIATLGTALTIEQAQLIKRYSNQINIAFDADSAGQIATLRAIETSLTMGLDPHILIFPAGYDPDRFIRTNGKETMTSLISEGIDFIDFMSRIKNLESVSEKKECIKEILKLISLIDENINRELYVNKLVETFKISKENLLKQIQEINKERKNVFNVYNTNKPKPSNILEERIMSIIVNNTEYARIAKQEIPAICFSSPENQKLIQIIYDNLESETFSTAKLIDMIEKPELRNLIFNFTFHTKATPTKSEFIRKLRTIKASWLYNTMLEAKTKGNNNLLEELSLQHYNLKRNISKRGS